MGWGVLDRWAAVRRATTGRRSTSSARLRVPAGSGTAGVGWTHGGVPGPATVVFDRRSPSTTSARRTRCRPIRVDLTMRLAERARRARRPAPRRRRPRWPPTDLIATVHDAGADRGGHQGRHHARVRRPGARPRHRRQPGLRGHAPRRRARGRRQRRGVPAGVERGVPAQRQHHRRPAPRDAGQRPAASASTTTSRSASSGCSTRAPSGSPTSTSTCTTATASSGSSGTTRGC